MLFVRLIVIIGLIGAGVSMWQKYRDRQAFAAVTDASGFVPVPMPDGAAPNKVLVFAPIGCPKEGAQRARALSQDLTARGISNALADRYSLGRIDAGPDSAATIKRLNAVMTGKLPIVLVNGMGKANPSTSEVLAEIARTRQR